MKVPASSYLYWLLEDPSQITRGGSKPGLPPPREDDTNRTEYIETLQALDLIYLNNYGLWSAKNVDALAAWHVENGHLTQDKVDKRLAKYTLQLAGG